jgi:hypothetical protein
MTLVLEGCVSIRVLQTAPPILVYRNAEQSKHTQIDTFIAYGNAKVKNILPEASILNYWVVLNDFNKVVCKVIE